MGIPCLIFGFWCSVSGPATAIDGDTLEVAGTRIRLWGIDAPELHEPLGHESKASLARILQGYSSITCYEVSFRSYSRRVSRCYAEGLDIAEHQIRSGLALDCKRFSRGRYRDLEPPAARYTLTQKPYC